MLQKQQEASAVVKGIPRQEEQHRQRQRELKGTVGFGKPRGGGDFPGGPVVNNPPSNAGDTGPIPGWELRSHVPQGN